jgi:hypothetical protein
MKTKIIEVVLTFYHLSNKSYELNKFAGRKQIHTLKPYQTAWIHLHKLHH